LGTAYYSAYADLLVEGYLDFNANGDLVTKKQADDTYINAAGDTMTGLLTIDGPAGGGIFLDSATLSGSAAIIDFDVSSSITNLGDNFLGSAGKMVYLTGDIVFTPDTATLNSGDLTVTGTTDTDYLIVQTGSEHYGDEHFYADVYTHADTYLGDAGGDLIYANGRFATDLVPSVDNVYRLGTNARRWYRAYIGDRIRVGDGSLRTVLTDHSLRAVGTNLRLATQPGYNVNIASGKHINLNPGSGRVRSHADIIPTTDGLYDLGRLSRRWGTLYAYGLDIDSIFTVAAGNGPEAGPVASVYEVAIDGDLEVTGTIDPTGILLEPLNNADIAIQVNNTGGVPMFTVDENGNAVVASNTTTDTLTVNGISDHFGEAFFFNNVYNYEDVWLGDAGGDDIFAFGRFNTNLIPDGTGLYNIGSSSRRWDRGFFYNNLRVGDGTVQTVLRDDRLVSQGATFRINSDPGYNININSGNHINLNPTGRVDVDGDLRPEVDSAYDLGSLTRRWDGVYANDFFGAFTGCMTTPGGSNYCDDASVVGNTQLGNTAGDIIDLQGTIRNTSGNNNGQVYVNDRLVVTETVGSGDPDQFIVRDNQGLLVEHFSTGVDLLSVDGSGNTVAYGELQADSVFYADPAGNAGGTGKEVAIVGDLYVSGSIDPTDIILTPNSGQTAIDVRDENGVDSNFTVDEDGNVYAKGNLDLGSGGVLDVENAIVNAQLTVSDLVVSNTAIINGTVSSNILPTAHNTYNLGMDGMRWRDVRGVRGYFGAHLSVAGINVVNKFRQCR
ncbi:MAG: hypothetical protein ACE5DX_04255, partial [Candidatus Dojkabacteria bacterium]